jgi:murein DD-endopeptidase MepM/ murein hydrolase activator NlpD
MGKENVNSEALKWYQKLRVKYKLTIRRQDTYEERFTFQISRMNVIIFTGAFAVLVIMLTTLFIAYTPLKEYIPGQTDPETNEQLYALQQKTDSLDREMRRKDLYLTSIKKILSGGELLSMAQEVQNDSVDYENLELKYSYEDSVLRRQFELQGEYTLSAYHSNSRNTYHEESEKLVTASFFKPLSGYITNSFDAAQGHLGVDIVPGNDKTVKATLSGTVIFSEWTVETGNVIVVQHTGNLISVYKHNATLLKAQGAKVDVGDPVAISGESGELSSGPHLHFELWFQGMPVDPETYILF